MENELAALLPMKGTDFRGPHNRFQRVCYAFGEEIPHTLKKENWWNRRNVESGITIISDFRMNIPNKCHHCYLVPFLRLIMSTFDTIDIFIEYIRIIFERHFEGSENELEQQSTNIYFEYTVNWRFDKLFKNINKLFEGVSERPKSYIENNGNEYEPVQPVKNLHLIRGSCLLPHPINQASDGQHQKKTIDIKQLSGPHGPQPITSNSPRSRKSSFSIVRPHE